MVVPLDGGREKLIGTISDAQRQCSTWRKGSGRRVPRAVEAVGEGRRDEGYLGLEVISLASALKIRDYGCDCDCNRRVRDSPVSGGTRSRPQTDVFGKTHSRFGPKEEQEGTRKEGR